MLWESYQQYFWCVFYSFYCACAAGASVRNCASGVVMAVQALSLLRQEDCSLTLPGELGRALRNSLAHNYRPGKTHTKLHVSIAKVSRDPALSRAALLLTHLGPQEVYTHQSLIVHHRRITRLTPLQKTFKMPLMNGPVPNNECGCCIDCEECECSDGGGCDCICDHDIGESSTSRPPPPPPLRPPPAHATHQPGPSRPQPRNPSPRRQRTRTRSRSRSPTPLVRHRRNSRERSRERSVDSVARYIARRVWKQARRDRHDMEEQCADQSRRTVAQFKIGHKEGIQCAQRLHNSYVLPENLSLTFIAGFMAYRIEVPSSEESEDTC